MTHVLHIFNMLFSDQDDDKHQVALIHFERESAAKTATLLSNGNVIKLYVIKIN